MSAARVLTALSCCLSVGILVADIDAVAVATLGEEDPEPIDAVPTRARVELGGRPSCIAVSGDGERVAAAIDGQVRENLTDLFSCILSDLVHSREGAMWLGGRGGGHAKRSIPHEFGRSCWPHVRCCCSHLVTRRYYCSVDKPRMIRLHERPSHSSSLSLSLSRHAWTQPHCPARCSHVFAMYNSCPKSCMQI